MLQHDVSRIRQLISTYVQRAWSNFGTRQRTLLAVSRQLYGVQVFYPCLALPSFRAPGPDRNVNRTSGILSS